MTWNFEHSITTKASKKALWALYSNVESWPIWDQGIENISLDGEFKEGAKGKIEPDGQGIMSYRIVFADPDKGFSDETIMDDIGAYLKFVHTFTDLSDGKIQLTHHVSISCPGKEEFEEKLGTGTSFGIPGTMESLARMAIFLDKFCKFR
ncbi:MAG: hypothetical protein M1414_06880 [Candidatus Thermoplasmatota archaeon]|jgi:hypothetical protein|nr:hypothetical protein [Candidatus Thermoplasmatota archaeon]MCL5988605.1 hypothetical protein [Candidatus Thermoplasmatota archaeon]